MSPRSPGAQVLNDFLESRALDWESFVALLLDSTRDGVVVVAGDGRVVFANRAARTHVAVAPGAPLRDSVPELGADLDRALAGDEEAPGAVLHRGEATYLTKVTPLTGAGSVLGALCVFVEITDSDSIVRQMRAYEELTREQEAIIDSSADGLWICDGQANVLRVNPASERLNAITAAQVVGRNMRDLVQEGFIDRSVTLEVIRTGGPVNMFQTRKDRKLMVGGVPVRDDAGRIIRVVVNERDITEIDALHRQIEEHENMRDRFRDQMLEMQLEKIESRRVIAKSPCMQKALRQAIKVASVDSTVLILGESGVGKGLIADLIHKYSRRAEKPLVKLNCGAIPESLVEAELFGYEKGAFTGAQATGKPGYFELADDGILFLDEIAELPLSSQVKLLRFLEDGKVMRVGGTQARKLDVRILAATHRDLRAMVDQGGFRLDLFYRLSVIPLLVPPLRERTECILPTLRHYIDVFGERIGARRRLSRAACDALLAYPWPGNVRELINLCERLVVMSEAETIDVADLPADIVRRSGKSGGGTSWPDEFTLQQAIESTERAMLLQARQQYANQALIGRALGVNQSTVARKLKKYGIA
ncbi:MAG TPA: sigma 54-interacting transcriptional regulator [Anaeromyxobacter sp.]